jgi:hypothetical protein
VLGAAVGGSTPRAISLRFNAIVARSLTLALVPAALSVSAAAAVSTLLATTVPRAIHRHGRVSARDRQTARATGQLHRDRTAERRMGKQHLDRIAARMPTQPEPGRTRRISDDHRRDGIRGRRSACACTTPY